MVTINTCFNFRIRKLFDILDIDPFLSERNIAVAYRKSARCYHPGKWNINKEYSYETNVDNFKRISNVY